MKTIEQINILKEFVEKEYLGKIQTNLTKGIKSIKIDFKDLVKFNPKLADIFLENPDTIKETFKASLEDFDLKSMPDVLIDKIPKTEEKQINRIRTKDLNKLISIKGIVTSRTKVYPRTHTIKFECPSCANIVNVLQTKETLKTAKNCGCGYKGEFKEIKKQHKDTIMLQIEDLPERLKGGEQPNTLRIILQNSLCDWDYKIILGARIELTGFLTEIPTRATRGTKTVNSDFLFTALNYNNLDFVDLDLNVSKEEQELYDEIKNKKNPAKFISNFVFNDIHGHSLAKECLVYQQFGGTRYGKDRDFIHILLFGMPGTAKTDMAFRVAKLNPIHKTASGPHISGVGLTATVNRDELTGNWVCIGGLLPRCNNGLAVIDEIEKMNQFDKNSLHTVMEEGFFDVNKASVSAKVYANTSIVSTSNPKVYEKGLKVSDNCDLPAPILDRFDLIFTFDDVIEAKRDDTIATKITERAMNEDTFKQNLDTFEHNQYTFEHKGNTFPITTLTKYIYLTKKIQPIVSFRAEKQLSLWYIHLRKCSLGYGFEGKKPTPRVLTSVLRLARAISRSKMKDKVTQKELALAISYFDFIYSHENTNVVEESVETEEKEKVSSTLLPKEKPKKAKSGKWTKEELWKKEK